MSLTVDKPRRSAHRKDILWYAALIHRVSGLLLVCFLPLHFLALGLAIEGEAALQGFISWTDHPTVKFAEMGLIFLLVVHAAGGVRLLVLENLAWRADHKNLAGLVFALAAVLAGLFFLRVI